jgi:hypothetical protein
VGLRGCSIAGSDNTSPRPTIGGAADKLPVLSLPSELCLFSLSVAEEVGFSAATPAEEGSTESLWAELPPELLAKVLEMLPAAEQSAPQAGGWRGCKDSAAVRLVCAQWQAVHDALVTRLVLRPETTDEGVGMLVRRFPSVVSLEVKSVYGVTALTDQGLRAVSSLASLTFLDLSRCVNITDEGVRAVSSLPALTFLDLAASKVTDEGVRAVASSCTALESLSLLGCFKVTDVGVRALSSLPALTSLNLTLCNNVTAAGVQVLRSTTAAPSLHIIMF